MKKVDMVIIGGGPAGLSAAIKAYDEGVTDILIIERNETLGGILRQCIHNGFGLHYFGQELTGPEYAGRLIEKVHEYGIPYITGAMVIDVNKDRVVTAVSQHGVMTLWARSIILAMGCRERPRGAINIPGDRCSGVFTAGTAQELVNMKRYKVGQNVVIMGSGDIGLIMARRLTYEGASVKAVVEILPYSSGLKRNIVQCLDDYGIPLMFSTTVTKIVGEERLEGVYIAEVDEKRNPRLETERYIECDTLLLSVGLIPENELSKLAGVKISGVTGGAVVDSLLQTNVSGIFACGNVLHIHDLVDNVTLEAFEAAHNAVNFLKTDGCGCSQGAKKEVKVETGSGVRYTVPQFINIGQIDSDLEIKFRSDNVYRDTLVEVYVNGDKKISHKKRIVTPGEMEKVLLTKDFLGELKSQDSLVVKIGE